MSDTHKSKVRSQFGPSADGYAVSDIHAAGESLGVLVELMRPQSAWRVLDVATGAGHTAMTLAAHVSQVVATDITEPMLAKTAELATAAGLPNLSTTHADAEDLPFDGETFEALTCRLAFHHFSDKTSALREFARVMKPGGVLGFTDNITVEDTAAADYYNRYETLRDPSHVRVESLPTTCAQIEGAGFRVRETRELSKEFEFHEWADRQRVSDGDKEQLLEMMRSIPEPLEPLFGPRWADDTMYFSLWEAVIVADLPVRVD